MPTSAGGFRCRLDDMLPTDTRDKNRRRRIEAEANRFAAALLMPMPKLRAALRRGAPDIAEIVELAHGFAVSKEAMARSWIDARDDAVAVLVAQHGRLLRCYRNQQHLPWIDVARGEVLPAASLASRHALTRGTASDPEECEPELWLGTHDAARVDVMTEQVLAMSGGYAMVLLHAELHGDDDEDQEDARQVERSWQPRR